MAASDLCAPSDVQAFLSLTAGQDDALLQTLCTAASAFVLSALNRNLLAASYSETRNGHGGDRLPLYQYPVTAVASVTVDGVAIPQAANSLASGFVFDDKMVYLRGYCFSSGVQNVAIEYTAGLQAAPTDLVQATVEIVALKYKRRLTLDVSGKTLNGETINFTQADVPASAKPVLQNYMRRYMA